jgi:hypothetical protein
VRSAGGGLKISIEPISPIIECWPSLPSIDELTEAERVATLTRPRADAPRSSRPEAPFGINAAFRSHAAALAGMSEEPDKRSDDDYEKEVDQYSKAYSRALQERCVWRVWRHLPICLLLEAVNLTEGNFTDIELQIHVPGDVRSWPEELDDLRRGVEPTLPDRPAVLGTPKRTFPVVLGDFNIARPVLNSYQVPLVNSGPSFTVKDTGSVTIDFSGIDLRPEQRLKLPPVRLLVSNPEGSVLDCAWKATAGNAPRQLAGTFILTVHPSTLSFESIEIDQETHVDEEYD